MGSQSLSSEIRASRDRTGSAASRAAAGVAAAAAVVLSSARPSPAGAPPPVQATAVPVADAFVFAGEANSNYGAAGVLAVSDATQPQGEYQSLMRFDLSAARSAFDAAFGPGAWTLQSATLRLTTSNPNNAIFNPNDAGPVAVSWMQDDTWAEGTGTPTAPTTDGVTYASLPSFVGAQDEPLGTINFPGGTSGANTYTLALSPGLAGDAGAGSALSLRLSPGPGEPVSYTFNSRSFQNVANRPVLTLTAVPEPGAAAFIAVAVLGAFGRRCGRCDRR